MLILPNLFRQSLHLLFDGVPDKLDLVEVRALLERLPGVERVHDLHVWAMGSTENAATVHLVLTEQADAATVLQAATQALRAGYGIGHATLQLETPAFAAACAVRHGESHG